MIYLGTNHKVVQDLDAGYQLFGPPETGRIFYSKKNANIYAEQVKEKMAHYAYNIQVIPVRIGHYPRQRNRKLGFYNMLRVIIILMTFVLAGCYVEWDYPITARRDPCTGGISSSAYQFYPTCRYPQNFHPKYHPQ